MQIKLFHSPFVLLVLFSTVLFSCSKTIEVKTAPELLPSVSIFEDSVSVTSAINGVYLRLRSASNDMSNAGLSLLTGLSSDELYNTASSTVYDPFAKNALTADNSAVYQNFWRSSYRTLYAANAVLEGLTLSNKISENFKRQSIGEMLVIRAWLYFYLTNLFGDVPLVLKTPYQANSVLPREKQAVIYAQIVKDLQQSKNDLWEDYPAFGKARVNKWTATALLARVKLYEKDWQGALDEASAIIASNRYRLLDNLNEVFIKGSEETIWEVAALNEAGNTNIGSIVVPASGTARPVLAMPMAMINSFAATDRRLLNWIKFNTNAGVRYYYPYKFKQRNAINGISEYNTMIRYDEILLIRAEASAHLENFENSQNDLNVIRRRAGLTDNGDLTKESLLTAILAERKQELFAEWGHRWFDLKRTGQANPVLSSFKGSNWQESDQLYPIPTNELRYNPNLIQNPGY